MNSENLHELINRYENNLDMLYSDKHDELFKWKAMKVWRDEWYKPDDAFASFADRYTAAKREFSLFIDKSRMHPSSGVIKLWEKGSLSTADALQKCNMSESAFTADAESIISATISISAVKCVPF